MRVIQCIYCIKHESFYFGYSLPPHCVSSNFHDELAWCLTVKGRNHLGSVPLGFLARTKLQTLRVPGHALLDTLNVPF